MEEFFSLQNAKYRDWSVVGSSNLFWHTIWTHPALLGCAPRQKVCAPMRHTRLKKNGRKCPFLGQNGDGCAWCPQIMWGAPAPPECVKQGLESKRMVYIHLPSTSRTEDTTQNVKAKIAIWVLTIF